MLLALIILYVVTLLYLSIVERFRHYAALVGLQGWLLLGVVPPPYDRLARIDLYPGRNVGFQGDYCAGTVDQHYPPNRYRPRACRFGGYV